MPKPNQQNQGTEFSANSKFHSVFTILAQVVVVNYYVDDEALEIVLLTLGSLLTIPITPFVEIGYNRTLSRFLPARRKAVSEEELKISLKETEELLVKLPSNHPYSSLLSEEREDLKRALEKSNPAAAAIHQIRDAIVADNNFNQAVALTKEVILESAKDYPVALDVWLAEFNQVNNDYKRRIINHETARQTFNRLNLLLLEFINENLKT